MRTNLKACLDLIIVENEGGFSNHPDDPGGPTNMGITQKTLSAWRKCECGIDDVKNLTRTEAEAIMEAQYAAPVRFNVLPDGLDYAVLDCSVNSGPARAAKILQSLVGVTEDGIIGEETLAALTAFLREDPSRDSEMIQLYCQARLAFCRSLKNWDTFGNGWAARVDRVEHRAGTLANGWMPAAKPPILVVPTGEHPAAGTGVAKAAGAHKMSATAYGKHAIYLVISTVITLGAAAGQATAFLAPYHNIKLVSDLITALAVLSAAGTFLSALKNAPCMALARSEV